MTMHKSLSRRSFLAGSVAAASLMMVPPGLAETAIVAPAPALPVPPDRWETLRRLTADHLVRPGDASYAKAALPNNLRFSDIRPQGVAYCTNPQMVADVISWCRDYDMPFAIRGGGHSYAGHSSHHGLVIDMREMRKIAYDADTQTVTVAAGALNGQVYSALNRAGRMITHGRCPGVGAAGFLLGGGIGFNMRRLGMGCDNVIASEIVTADGRVLTLSANENSDLFWATRGGAGGNFGVSTSFTIKTAPADARITVFRMVWRENTRDVARVLFATAEAAPTTLGSRIALGGVTQEQAERGRQVPVTLLGQFAGSQEDFMALMAPVLAAGTPEFSDVQELPYWESQNFLSEPGAPAWFRERSTFLPAAPDGDFIDAAFERLYQWPGTGAHGDLFFFQTGGQINALASDATAFAHRDSRWLSVVGFSWSEDDAARPDVARRASDWQDSFYQQVSTYGAGAFQNFPDNALVDWRQRYYGANLARLEAVKAAVDPTNIFQHGQSI